MLWKNEPLAPNSTLQTREKRGLAASSGATWCCAKICFPIYSGSFKILSTESVSNKTSLLINPPPHYSAFIATLTAVFCFFLFLGQTGLITAFALTATAMLLTLIFPWHRLKTRGGRRKVVVSPLSTFTGLQYLPCVIPVKVAVSLSAMTYWSFWNSFYLKLKVRVSSKQLLYSGEDHGRSDLIFLITCQWRRAGSEHTRARAHTPIRWLIDAGLFFNFPGRGCD